MHVSTSHIQIRLNAQGFDIKPTLEDLGLGQIRVKNQAFSERYKDITYICTCIMVHTNDCNREWHFAKKSILHDHGCQCLCIIILIFTSIIRANRYDR